MLEINIRIMLQDLLLNQACYKKEICKMVKISLRSLNKILEIEESNYNLNYEAIKKITKLYYRMKSFEDRIDEWLVKIPKKIYKQTL
ncbi:MAG: hypothetical protein A3E87_02640 [Gammaproteobacteria bacterium RIFCSPHIGHO2_12_FULL_35_23]|nr:MAG: hypothetical protein A3E87_02640 [Gammaproteobacteria bacterium RIFCSPHIGHO2_12_FULL_35_23]